MPHSAGAWGGRLRIAAKIALLLVIAWALVRFGGFGFSELRWVFGHPLLIACAILAVWGGQLFGAQRFQVILRQQNLRQSFLGSLSLVCAAQFASNVLIGTVGGDGIRYLLLAPRTEEASVATLAAIALDRLLGLLGLLSVGLAALLLRLDLVSASSFLSRLLVVGVGLCAGAAAAAIVFFAGGMATRCAGWITRRIRPGRLSRVVQAVGQSVALIAADPRTALYGFALSLAANLLPMFGFFAIAMTMPQMTMSPVDFGFVLPTALLANSLSITPGGLGVGEGTFGLLARAVAAQPSIGFAALFFSFRLISALATLPGLIPLLTARQARAKPDNPAAVWKARAESP